MLPNLRLVIAGCLASFVALMGALSAISTKPSDSKSYVTTARLSPARGPMMDAASHPEWRPFLVRAAMVRADEVKRLLDLPDQRGAVVVPASLPADPVEAVPEDITGSIVELPAATMPVDIGASSSTELPVIRESEPQPAPAAVKPQGSSARPVMRKRIVRRATAPRTASTATTTSSSPANPFTQLFGQ